MPPVLDLQVSAGICASACAYILVCVDGVGLCVRMLIEFGFDSPCLRGKMRSGRQVQTVVQMSMRYASE